MSKNCFSNVCQAERLENDDKFKRACVTGFFSVLTTIRFQIITHISLTTQRQKQSLKFKCKYNECNSVQALCKVQNTIDQYYNLSTVYKALGHDKQTAEETNTTNDTTAISTLLSVTDVMV